MLYQDFLINSGRTIHKVAHYFPVYERHFKKFVNQSVVFWEIGVFKGGSLQMWKRYLGPFATIVGIDIDPACKAYEEHQIHVRIGDQSDVAFLQSVIDEFGAPDVVLDDGSHVMSDICATFDYLYDRVSKNGVYFVEDLVTAYWSRYGGGLRREGTFIERCKEMVDSLNARHNDLPRGFADSTFAICFYDSIVVFEKMQWRDETYHVEMTPPTITAQLFLCSDNGYCEKNSILEMFQMKNSYFKVIFDLRNINSALPHMKEIRLDPSAEPIELYLTEAQAIYSNGDFCELNAISHNGEVNNAGGMSFNHSDPIIIFDSSSVDFKKVDYVSFSGKLKKLR